MADDFYLFANCNFVPDKYPDWQAAYDDLAIHVWANEPATKTYHFGIPIDYAHDFDKTTSMLAFEIYKTREDLYGETGHLGSPSMATFLTRIPSASTTGLDLNHYRLISGFLDLPGTGAPEAIMQDVIIKCNTPADREKLLKSLATLVDNVEKEERANGGKSGVLTYMCFASLDNEAGARIYGRWKTREDLERFIRREDVNGFWMAEKEGIRGMEQRLYVPNKKGWLHRGSGYAGEVKK